jgi:hypothetical protein
MREGWPIVFRPKISSKWGRRRPVYGSGSGEEARVGSAGWIVFGLFGVALVTAAGRAEAQSNLDAGKSPAQIFSDTCNACHRNPRELKPTNAGFLREHYTTGAREAAAMAAYVAAIGSDPNAVRNRKPPVMGAGRDPPPQPAADKPPQGSTAALRPRRPSESVDGAIPSSVMLATGTISATAEAPSPNPSLIGVFEE